MFVNCNLSHLTLVFSRQFSTHNLGTFAPRMNVLYWGPGDFPVSYSNRDTSRNAWNRHSGSFMVDMGILFSNMKYPSRMLNDILILDQQWLPNKSDFPPISWPWYRAWPSPIMSGFDGAFGTGVACQQGTLTTPDTWFRPLLGACMCSDCWDQFSRLYTDLMTYRSWLSPNWEVSMEHLRQVWHASRERLPFRTPGSVPILGLANAPIVETKFLELAMSLLDFSPRIPLGTFSILLTKTCFIIIISDRQKIIYPCSLTYHNLI